MLSGEHTPAKGQGLADRLRSDLREDRLQGADARRQGVAVVGDGAGKKATSAAVSSADRSRFMVPIWGRPGA